LKIKIVKIISLMGIFVFSFADPAAAYIGPGAGFAFLSSFFVLFLTFFAAAAVLATLPLRLIYRRIKMKKRENKPTARRVVVVGFDGMDPILTRELMDQGRLPNFAKVAGTGVFTPLGTTYPSVSPVAWSTFQTGVGPGKHGIYDFLSRDKATYLPRLSSVEITPPSKFIKIGKWRIPLGQPIITLLRKSKPFWSVLSEYGIFSQVIRVPITFPPEKFNGTQLSAMCVPDILGTQGTFFAFDSTLGGKQENSSDEEGGSDALVGTFLPMTEENGFYRASIPGPPNSMISDSPELKIDFKLIPSDGGATLEIGKKTINLKLGEYSDWVELEYRAAPWAKIKAIGRFLLKSVSPVKLYLTPVQIDPAKPAMPISHPLIYSIYLARRFGSFSTLGLAEDTWGLDERVLDDVDFINQLSEIGAEREKMLFDALDKSKNGLVVCVFDETDRGQHMFWRYRDPDHRGPREEDDGPGAKAIENIYVNADRIVGRVLNQLHKDDLLVILSDHGFNSYRRGVNLNRWLLDNGYLNLKNGKANSEWYADVDWENTKAYSFGLGGLYLNIKGREALGVVERGADERALKNELIEKLSGLKDEDGSVAIRRMIDGAEVFKGPYADEAPDLISGYSRGYRTAWDAVKGIVGDEVFTDNTRCWSGDHCIDPQLIPGVLFCNRPIASKQPGIIDIAPSVLEVFGITVPAYMEGTSIFAGGEKDEQ
jgi:predicted AlkP superfamily phosphohydrolase/phosphomutase